MAAPGRHGGAGGHQQAGDEPAPGEPGHLGYVEREAGEDGDGRARVVRLTQRGHAAWNKEVEVLARIEAEWRAVLGEERFETLKGLLTDVWKSELIP